jgi:hypothetical protein
MTGGRTRPTHDALAIETLVSTTSTVDLTPKLTVEQRGPVGADQSVAWPPLLSVAAQLRPRGENSRQLVPAEMLGAVAYRVEIAGDGS